MIRVCWAFLAFLAFSSFTEARRIWSRIFLALFIIFCASEATGHAPWTWWTWWTGAWG